MCRIYKIRKTFCHFQETSFFGKIWRMQKDSLSWSEGKSSMDKRLVMNMALYRRNEMLHGLRANISSKHCTLLRYPLLVASGTKSFLVVVPPLSCSHSCTHRQVQTFFPPWCVTYCRWNTVRLERNFTQP